MTMKQTIEMRIMTKTERMMNNQSIVYKIASIIEITDKILENEMIEMIVWASTSFLNDECRDFSMRMKMMNHCRDFVILLKFLKMMIEIFPEFLIEMAMKMIAWGNFSLLTIREVIVSLMLAEMLFLLLIDLEVMNLEIQMILEMIVEMIVTKLHRSFFFALAIASFMYTSSRSIL
jgi:hypothetical protein